MNKFKPLIAASLIGLSALGSVTMPSAQAQTTSAPSTPARAIEPQEFLRLAYSSSSLQGQASKLASDRETRPEVKSYATAAAAFRLGLLQKIEAFAKDRGLPLPATQEFEHRVIIENLEPLDYLALSRRYAEIQLQALDQEIGIYRAASQSSNQEIKTFADEILPQLQQQREGAQKVFDTVKP